MTSKRIISDVRNEIVLIKINNREYSHIYNCLFVVV